MSWALIRIRLPSLWTLPSTGQCGKILYDSWLRLLALEFLTMVWRRALGDEAPRILEPTTERLSSNSARGCVVSLLHSGVLCSSVEVAQASVQRRAIKDRTAVGQREAGQYRLRCPKLFRSLGYS